MTANLDLREDGDAAAASDHQANRDQFAFVWRAQSWYA